MRVKHRIKSKKVRRSQGRSSSGSFNDTPTNNSTSLNSSSHQKRKIKMNKLRRRIAKKAKKRAVVKLYALRTALGEQQLSIKGLSNPTAWYYAFDGRLTCVAQNCEAFNEFCRDADLQDADTKQLILKLLGDKSSVAVSCYDDEANQLQDMDLMILGSTPEEYKRYTQLLRQEYMIMNDADYKQMRLKVLQTLLMIPNIFACPEFQARYEQLARTNIKQEIEELKQ